MSAVDYVSVTVEQQFRERKSCTLSIYMECGEVDDISVEEAEVLVERLQAAIDFAKAHGLVENPESIAIETFRKWATAYFLDTEVCRLDRFLLLSDVLCCFERETGLNWTCQKFKRDLFNFCYRKDLDLNPKEFRDNSGRVLRESNGRMIEMIYIRKEEGGEE